jgi:hypothetical protein
MAGAFLDPDHPALCPPEPREGTQGHGGDELVRNQYRFMKPPAALRRAHLEKVALVPGNLLPQIQRWQHLAGQLPADEFVILLPEQDAKQRHTLEAVAALLRQSGHHVRVVTEQELSRYFGEDAQESLEL